MFVPSEEFTPGARTLGDELFPQTGNGGYDAVTYDIDLIYDPVENVFSKARRRRWTATATQNLSEFSMDFQDIASPSVTVNGSRGRLVRAGGCRARRSPRVRPSR